MTGTPTTLERLKRELLDETKPSPVFLLGAGASVKSGVPTAAGFAEMIARWAYLKENGRDERDQNVHRSDWLPWLKRFAWYNGDQPVGYGNAFMQLVGTGAGDRRAGRVGGPGVAGGR